MCTYIMTPIMRAINDTECTHLHPSNRKPNVSPLKLVPENLSTCSNSPSCLVDSTGIVYESAGSPPTCRVHCVIKRPSIVHCGPKPPKMMANRPAPISDSSFNSIWGLMKVERGSSKENSIFWIFWICAIFELPQTRGTRISEKTVYFCHGLVFLVEIYAFRYHSSREGNGSDMDVVSNVCATVEICSTSTLLAAVLWAYSKNKKKERRKKRKYVVVLPTIQLARRYPGVCHESSLTKCSGILRDRISTQDRAVNAIVMQFRCITVDITQRRGFQRDHRHIYRTAGREAFHDRTDRRERKNGNCRAI